MGRTRSPRRWKKCAWRTAAFDSSKEYKYCEELLTEAEARTIAEEAGDLDVSDAPAFARYALLEFGQPITRADG